MGAGSTNGALSANGTPREARPPALAITRKPDASLVDCELTHLERASIDVERALVEHAAYVERLRALGVEVEVLEPLSGFPDACFVEDTAIVLDEVAILTRPGATSRRGEVDSMAEALAPHRQLFRLEAPATLDGGDVVVTDDTLFVGVSARTNHAGLKELAHRVLPLGLRVKAVEVNGCLHLKSAMSLVAPKTLLVQPNWIDLGRIAGFDFIPVASEEPAAANAVRVGGSLLHPAGFPRTANALRAHGLEVASVAIGEFQKAEGAASCLSLLLDRA
ncbi:MAG: arginine deiminase family protein [Planctomycetota bacterium]|jgi:dimethylargininase|nr:arginine deiminase family protein [Planctomycetota bacterium]MDP6763083.1 arginine deiminase family protein [Planctomycetota bacterium]MDP6989020.1 arginine deiminase family protein [Planctomycetota bacterium]